MLHRDSPSFFLFVGVWLIQKVPTWREAGLFTSWSRFHGRISSHTDTSCPKVTIVPGFHSFHILSVTQRLFVALPDLRLGFAFPVPFFFPGTAGASLSSSSLFASSAASAGSESGSSLLPAGSSAGLSRTTETWDVGSSFLMWRLSSWSVLPVLVAEVLTESFEVGSGSAFCWFSVCRVSVMMGWMEFRLVTKPVSSEREFSSVQSVVVSVTGLMLSAARRDSLEDSTAPLF
ncbi:hypothetical protein PFLUV_G00202330 [Perca fluviatilis]|uniref:Uncharacterized protein n=1 Tax=Perca fluviatilis TaxID=8168 RepID=A0A6A5DTV7_PERFL|nr:hypothetical protein PFLUV_G00202330 [Perca fluviatilis]